MTSRSSIQFLVDEDVPQEVADFLVMRGYRVVSARQVLGVGQADPVIAEHSIREGMIVLSRNVRDYRRLSRRRRFRELSYLGLTCRPEVARERLEQLLDVVESMVERAHRSGHPFNMEIGNETFSVRDG